MESMMKSKDRYKYQADCRCGVKRVQFTSMDSFLGFVRKHLRTCKSSMIVRTLKENK